MLHLSDSSNKMFTIFPVQCKALTVGNALVSPSGPVQVNSVAKVTCMSDHLHYLISVTCEAGETWSSTPTCQNMGMIVSSFYFRDLAIVYH